MKKITLLLGIILSAGTLLAEVRTPEAAARLAADFTDVQTALCAAPRQTTMSSQVTLAHTFTKPASTDPALYVFNRAGGQGFVIVSADDRTMDILCYADEGTFDLETANPAFQWWISRYTEQIASVDSTNAYTGGSMVRQAASATAISPLLGNTAWDQTTPYWNKCPMDLWKTTERCLTGCVATAAAQVMRYWQHPATGTGSHSYDWECCMNSRCTRKSTQTLSLDFSTITFDWANMLDTYGSSSSYTRAQADAVATLMYACGVACDMQYGGDTNGGSGAYTDAMGYGLTEYFGYDRGLKFMTAYSKSAYGPSAMTNAQFNATTAQFTTAFNAELEAGRPIVMGGESSDGGHEFVCDGRDSQGRFHINWGWAGDCNCYCALTSLRPTGETMSFSSNIDALIGLKPANDPTGITPTRLAEPEKYIQNGHLYIRRGNQLYTLTGTLL